MPHHPIEQAEPQHAINHFSLIPGGSYRTNVYDAEGEVTSRAFAVFALFAF